MSLKYFRHSMERYKYLTLLKNQPVEQFENLNALDTFYENNIRIKTPTQLFDTYETYLREILNGNENIELRSIEMYRNRVVDVENRDKNKSYHIVFGSKSYASILGRENLALDDVVYMFISQYIDIFKHYVISRSQYTTLDMENLRKIYNAILDSSDGIFLTRQFVNKITPLGIKGVYEYKNGLSPMARHCLNKYLPASLIAYNLRDKCKIASRDNITNILIYLTFDYGKENKDLLATLNGLWKHNYDKAEKMLNEIIQDAKDAGKISENTTDEMCTDVVNGLLDIMFNDKILNDPMLEYETFIHSVNPFDLYFEIYTFSEYTRKIFWSNSNDSEDSIYAAAESMTNKIFSELLKYKELTKAVKDFLINHPGYEFPKLDVVFTHDKLVIDHAICTIFKMGNPNIDEINKSKADITTGAAYMLQMKNTLIGVVCDPNFCDLINVDSLQPLFMYLNPCEIGAFSNTKIYEKHKDTGIVVNKMRHMLGGTNEMITRIITWLLFIIALVVIVCVLVIFFVNIRNKQHYQRIGNNFIFSH